MFLGDIQKRFTYQTLFMNLKNPNIKVKLTSNLKNMVSYGLKYVLSLIKMSNLQLNWDLYRSCNQCDLKEQANIFSKFTFFIKTNVFFRVLPQNRKIRCNYNLHGSLFYFNLFFMQNRFFFYTGLNVSQFQQFKNTVGIKVRGRLHLLDTPRYTKDVKNCTFGCKFWGKPKTIRTRSYDSIGQ